MDDAAIIAKSGELFRGFLSKSDVFNIALTGPYGSGKSSIIQTFLKKHPLPVLQISLAAFVPEADHKTDVPEADHETENGLKLEEVSRQEIERSILQQMLYGADANKLPLSRFKRIQTPSFFSFLKSLYILAGALAFWFVFQQREGITESFINGALFCLCEDANISGLPDLKADHPDLFK